MRQTILGLSLLLVPCAFLWACGGEGRGSEMGDKAPGTGETCAPVEGCGGDIEGEWLLESMCLTDLNAFVGGEVDAPECRDAFGDLTVNPDGGFSFDGSGMVTAGIRYTLDLEVNVTAACARAQRGSEADQADCDELAVAFESQATFDGAACAQNEGGCDCIVTTVMQMIEGTQEYLAEGDLLITGEGASSEATEYCVEGETLTVGIFNPDANLVLRRQ